VPGKFRTLVVVQQIESRLNRTVNMSHHRRPLSGWVKWNRDDWRKSKRGCVVVQNFKLRRHACCSSRTRSRIVRTTIFSAITAAYGRLPLESSKDMFANLKWSYQDWPACDRVSHYVPSIDGQRLRCVIMRYQL
jgi:hypothetical protein